MPGRSASTCAAAYGALHTWAALVGLWLVWNREADSLSIVLTSFFPPRVRAKVGALLSLVRGDRWDVAAWHALLGEITAWPVAAARSLYEEAVGVFPMGARVWVQYVEAEIKVRCHNHVWLGSPLRACSVLWFASSSLMRAKFYHR